ncbi:mitochondrial import inner membrane translocase subunit tim16 [Nannochloropsis oceanica]
MSGPFVRMLVNIAVMSASVFSRAFVAAYHQALQNAKQGGGTAAKAASRTYGGMAPDEALKVLNLQKTDMKNPARLIEQFDKYFMQNEPGKGGSFYLQSKVYRAKECLEKAIEEERGKAAKAKAEADDARKANKSKVGGKSP